MIQTGNTIVVHNGDGTLGFFWHCDSRQNEYVFFNWYGNPRRATLADYWEVGKDWFSDRLADGTIEVFDSLPLDKYGDIFEQQAIERNN